jgi:hypothetical protein
MAELRFDFEWLDPLGSRGAELRATWARLQIIVAGEPTTRVVDHATKSVRNSIYVPLYPLAEWFATNWWFLFGEFETPGRYARSEYERRHDLRFAQEGFALPSILIRPGGPHVRFDWRGASRPHQHVDFIASGAASIRTEVLQDAIASFIQSVLGRLADEGVFGTLLQEEWTAISEADPEEKEFSLFAAALGIDPYAVPDATATTMIEAAELLPADLLTDFFSVAEPDALSTDAWTLKNAVSRAHERSGIVTSLHHIRQQFRPRFRAGEFPWEQGYRVARELRSELGLNGQPIWGLSGLAEAIHTSEQNLEDAIVHDRLPLRGVDAVVANEDGAAPGFVVDARGQRATRFAVCRGLFEYLVAPDASASLITRTHSDRQKRTRAFAAEFLLPASALKHRINSDVVTEDEVDDFAAEYDVSPLVVRHQLVNHRIAAVELD